MIFRNTYLENSLTLGNSGERTVDLNIIDPMTVLLVKLMVQNGAQHNKHSPVHDAIDTIEIIDGSTVLYSLDGYQALALAANQLGKMPEQLFSALGGDYQTAILPIMFGRYIGDREYAFDPAKFVNPQLRIKWNLANVHAVGDTGFATGGAALTVIAQIMEGATPPRALLMAKENYTWTSAAGVEYIDLPRDHPYRGLMFRGHLAAYHPYGILSNVKLNCDAGKVVPFDMETIDLLEVLKGTQPKFQYRISDHLANGDTFYSVLEEKEDVAMIGEGGNVDEVITYANYEYGSQTVTVYNAGVAAGEMNIGAHVHGYCPFGYIYVPFGDPNIPSDWFQAQQFGSVRFEATGAVAAASCALCLVQERPY
jgi:hypothetical protein